MAVRHVASKMGLKFLLLFMAFSTSFPAQARKHSREPIPNPRYEEASKPATASDDSDLIRAVRDRRNIDFVQAANVTVLKIHPEDHQGLPHQKWTVTLSDGSKVLAVYNTDMGAHIPLQVGQKMGLGGQFKWTNQGALIHWLHYDPRQQRPDGYVEVNGQRYGKRP